MKRIFDFTMAFGALVLLSVPMLIIAVLVKLTSKGPALYWSGRVGNRRQRSEDRGQRAEVRDTPAVATHLMKNPDVYLTPIGSFLRK